MATPIIITPSPPPPPPPDKPQRSAAKLSTSDAGINFIKQFEGLKLKAYKDVVGVWTIGYGTTKGVKSGQVIAEAEAEKFLRADVAEFESVVSKIVKVPLKQYEFDALVSFTYNVGKTALANSSLLTLLNAGERERAADQFLRWDKAKGCVFPGLTRRRKAERAMFLGRTQAP
jgi:lysozyme